MRPTSTAHLAAYFSHSWNPRDVNLNLVLWEHISQHCHLIIDKPEKGGGGKPPYFISRIESLLRRSDVFVACLPTLPPERQRAPTPGSTGDWRYTMCSPYILFELRLAERADIPRFLLYDHESRFQPPAHPPPHVRYFGCRFGELRAKLASGGQDANLIEAMDQWLSWVERHHHPLRLPENPRAAFMLSDDASGRALTNMVIEAVDAGGLGRPEPLTTMFHTDAELYQSLRSLALLVVDVSSSELLPLYYAAHSLFVPTVRIHYERGESDNPLDDFLPTILRGHPAGYQHDMLNGSPGADTFDALRQRSIAIIRSAEPVIGFESGRKLLYERTYLKHFVFISHDQKLNNRALVDAIVSQCNEYGITQWEYSTANRSGEGWRVPLTEALAKTTIMIALLSDNYDGSPTCREEWDFAMSHRPAMTLLPFLVNGRIHAANDLKGECIANKSLDPARSPHENAAIVVGRIREILTQGRA